MLLQKLIVLSFFISSFYLFSQESQDIEIKVFNISSSKGSILIGLYNTESSFLKESFKSAICKASSKGITYTFKDVPVGTYAISLFHDKDDNKKLNTFLKIPTENYGTSNNAPVRFGPPQWKDAKFEVLNTKVIQEIILK